MNCLSPSPTRLALGLPAALSAQLGCHTWNPLRVACQSQAWYCCHRLHYSAPQEGQGLPQRSDMTLVCLKVHAFPEVDKAKWRCAGPEHDAEHEEGAAGGPSWRAEHAVAAPAHHRARLVQGVGLWLTRSCCPGLQAAAECIRPELTSPAHPGNCLFSRGGAWQSGMRDAYVAWGAPKRRK